MSGKRILATIFAGLILLKLLVSLTNPTKWLGLTAAFLGHPALVMGIYLVLLVITGYYIFSSLNLLDIAVVMFFSSLLIGFTLIPYSSLLLKLSEGIATAGLGQAWLAVVIWAALAVAVLCKVFSRRPT
jgi:hypothetical protein